MRGLIVNADDFGLSRGINQGISEAHRNGIVTSTSLMVDTPFSEQAAALSAELPRLTVGLHAELTAIVGDLSGEDAAATCEEELERQIARFRALTGCWPSHLDSHHNLHRRPDLVDAFVRVGRRHRLPVREHSDATYVSSFYGQSGGETALEQVSVRGLERVLRAHGDPLLELGCHPGYADPDLHSSYRQEREAELHTLCDARAPQLLEDLDFILLDSRLCEAAALQGF
jgi:predicted glycoside hydrolase/deacetylase ChbG (UPF0249 family)